MKSKKNIKLLLTITEKATLRMHEFKIADVLNYASDELEADI